jgi:hypothetical protein
MAEISQEQFLQRYGNFMVHSWGMPALKTRFKQDPAEVLKEYGMDPGNARVTVMTPETPNQFGITDRTMESQYRLWLQGKQQGNIPFYYMEEPPEGIGSEALSDEELMAVAGGVSTIHCCCCCTPCCSC